MMRFEMDELLPIVADLAQQYTKGANTSVTYEKARQFMEAVLYCIGMCEKNILENQLPVSGDNLSARDAYRAGYRAAARKVAQTREKYNEMITEFRAYGNENYQDSVTKAIPGFFLYYDVKFAPQETIITMDYPTLRPITDMTGINAIEKYVDFICLEQRFMNQFPENYICDVLERYEKNYRRQFYNICRIVLRHVLTCMIVGKTSEDGTDPLVYEKLKQMLYGVQGSS